MREILKLKDWSWVSVFRLAWELQELAEKKVGGKFDCRTLELVYGPAAAEALIRIYGESLKKLLPTAVQIEKAYFQVGGTKENLWFIDKYLPPAFELAEEFACISGDKNVAVGAGMQSTAQVICVLAHKLGPVPRQKFQEAFTWDEDRRARVFNDDEKAAWNALEFELGMGICAAVSHAKQILPDLTAEEFATALLRKYGIPVMVDGIEVFACHWCATGFCSCGGGKSPIRSVTYEEAAKNLHRGPRDTQKGMLPYEWPNIGRAGAGYGPFRALLEAAAEKGIVACSEGSLSALQRRFGPFLIPQQRHIAEVIGRFGRGPDKDRKALLSELADAVHWPFAGYGAGVFDHTAGLRQALLHIAGYCEVEVELPL